MENGSFMAILRFLKQFQLFYKGQVIYCIFSIALFLSPYTPKPVLVSYIHFNWNILDS